MNYLAFCVLYSFAFVKRYETPENTKFLEKEKAKFFFVKTSVEFLTYHKIIKMKIAISD